MTFGVVLIHGIYPMHLGDKPVRERGWTVWSAKRRVREIYRGRIGWWYQIMRNGKEVWSSDHDLAALSEHKSLPGGLS
jgi:hypothetical protein